MCCPEGLERPASNIALLTVLVLGNNMALTVWEDGNEEYLVCYDPKHRSVFRGCTTMRHTQMRDIRQIYNNIKDRICGCGISSFLFETNHNDNRNRQ